MRDAHGGWLARYGLVIKKRWINVEFWLFEDLSTKLEVCVALDFVHMYKLIRLNSHVKTYKYTKQICKFEMYQCNFYTLLWCNMWLFVKLENIWNENALFY